MRNLKLATILSIAILSGCTMTDYVKLEGSPYFNPNGNIVHFMYQRTGRAFTTKFDQEQGLARAKNVCLANGFNNAKFLHEKELPMSSDELRQQQLNQICYEAGVGGMCGGYPQPTRKVYFQCFNN